ncbi:MAG: hypothetical protein QW767_01300 [Thermoprotei archaeon]
MNEIAQPKTYGEANRAARLAAARGDAKTLNEMDSIRERLFSKSHRRLPGSLKSPLTLGLLTLVGALLIYLGGQMTYSFVQWTLFFLGCIVLMFFSHPLGHSVTGAVTRIRFGSVYLAGRIGIEPTLLLSLSSYYRAKRRSRFVMHAGGPVATSLAAVFVALTTNGLGYPFPIRILSDILLAATLLSEAVYSSRKGDIARGLRALRAGV